MPHLTLLRGGKDGWEPSPPSFAHNDYEANEAHIFHRDLAEAERSGSPEDCEFFRQAMAHDPGLVSERIGWLLNGNYGYGAMKYAERIVNAPRMNRTAALVQLVGALEWHCPRHKVAKEWRKLTTKEKKSLEVAVSRHLPRSNKRRRNPKAGY